VPRWASDDNLVQAAREGDEDAFALLMERHREWVRRLINAVVRDAEQAEDLTQEAFCRVHRNLGGYTEQERFVPYLKRIAVNLARNFLRDQKRRAALTEHLRREPPLGLIIDPLAMLDLRAMRAELRDALDRLGPEQRQALLLHYFSGLSVEEIAREVDCPPGTVKSRLFHARRQVRRALAAALETDE
jgi:RNA polymerase sigma-70 factor, ECF subfamily